MKYLGNGIGSINNYNREKNRKRKINSSGGNNVNKNNKLMNDMDYVLIKARTPNFMSNNNNKIKKNGNNKIKKPRTPEIKNLNNKGIVKDINKINNKNNNRPSTAPHNNIHIKK